MKKLGLILFSFWGISSMTMVAHADDKPIEVNQLPAAARAFVQKFFASEKIQQASVDNDIINKTYEVRLSGDIKIEFNSGGQWRQVDAPKGVPASLVPAPIAEKVKQLHPNAKIVGLDKERSGYTVELDNDVEIHFNNKFKIMQIEDDPNV